MGNKERDVNQLATQEPVYTVYQTAQLNKKIIHGDFEPDTKALPPFLLNPNPQPMILPPMNEEESPGVWSQVSQQINSIPNHTFTFSKNAAARTSEFMIEIQTSNPPGQRGVNISVKQLIDDAEPLPTLEQWQAYFNGDANLQLTKKLQSISNGSESVTAIINEQGDLEFFAKNDAGALRNLTEQEIAVLAIDVAALMQVGIKNACVYQHKFGEGQDLGALMSAVQSEEYKENTQPEVNVAERIAWLNNGNIKVSKDLDETIFIKNEGGGLKYYTKMDDETGVKSLTELNTNNLKDGQIILKIDSLISQAMNLDNAGFEYFQGICEESTLDRALQSMPGK